MKNKFPLKLFLLSSVAIVTEGTAIAVLLKALKNRINFAERYKAYYETLIQFIDNKKNKIDICEYFKDEEIKKVAIYGKGSLGELFFDEIKEKPYEIVCFIDKNAKDIIYDSNTNIPVVSSKEKEIIQQADIIVVTPVFDYDSISKDLFHQGYNDVISLEDILYNSKYELGEMKIN